MEAFVEWLQTTEAREVPKTKPIVLNSSATLASALCSLLYNNVRSAPVWSEENKAFIGVLDVRNVLKLCFENVFVDLNCAPSLSDFSSTFIFLGGSLIIQIAIGIANDLSLWMLFIFDIIFTCIIFFNTFRQYLIPLYSIKFSQKFEYVARMQKFKTHPPNANLLTLIETLSGGQHVVGILNDDSCSDSPDHIQSVITQGKLMELILQKWPEEPGLTCKEVGGMKTPVCINYSASTKTAFQTMARQNLSCLAVVKYSHPARHLVNHISTRDIRGSLIFGVDHTLSVDEYLTKARRSPFKDISVSPNAPFEKVKQHFQNGFHHVWIVSRGKYYGRVGQRLDGTQDEVTGVISMTDAFRYVLSKCKKDDDSETFVRREIVERPPSAELTPMEYQAMTPPSQKPRKSPQLQPDTPIYRPKLDPLIHSLGHGIPPEVRI